MKAKRFLYFIIFILSSVSVYATSDKIVYILPDSLESKVIDQINTYNEKNSLVIYLFHLEKNICLLISPYKNKSNYISPLYYYASKSNRFLLVGDNIYPIVFDYDFRYGTTTPLDQTGKYGEREGCIKRTAIILDINDFIKL